MTDLYALSTNPATPCDVIRAACDEILRHSVRYPYADVVLARQILDASKTQGKTSEGAKT